MVGAPGTRYFTFTGVKAGTCTFRMAYAQPWMFDWADETKNSKDDAGDWVEFPVTVTTEESIAQA